MQSSSVCMNDEDFSSLTKNVLELLHYPFNQENMPGSISVHLKHFNLLVVLQQYLRCLPYDLIDIIFAYYCENVIVSYILKIVEHSGYVYLTCSIWSWSRTFAFSITFKIKNRQILKCTITTNKDDRIYNKFLAEQRKYDSHYNITNPINDDYVQFFNYFMKLVYDENNFISVMHDNTDMITYKQKNNTIIDVSNTQSGIIRTILNVKHLTLAIMIIKLLIDSIHNII